jgi:hypothetical protein
VSRVIELMPNCLSLRSYGARFVAVLAIAGVVAALTAPGASAAGDCSSSGPALEAATPGTPQFKTLVESGLAEGCFAYVNDPTTLYVEIIRGPATGETKAIGPTGAELFDIALAPSGALYGARSNSVFYTVDRETGAATAVGGIGFFVNGLTVSPAGVVYGAGNSTLVTIDPATGKGTPTEKSIGLSSSGDLAFSASGDLYMSSTPGDNLAKLNPATGVGAVVGPIGSTNVYGLGESLGTLFGITQAGVLLTIDTATGAGTALTPSGPSALGMATALGPPPAPPAPAVPPVVKITSGPPKETPKQRATFAFVGVAGGSYECSVDGGKWTACKSGDSFGPLVPGDHRFQVRETLNGLTGPADSYFWTVALPKACVLRVARARVFVFASKQKVRLVIRYTAYRPADVTVSYALSGAKGKLALGSATSRFKKAGLFRLPEPLGKTAIGKVRAAKLFKVKFKIAGTPSSCGRYYTKRLTIPKVVSGQPVWFQSDSIFTSGGGT